MLKKVNIGGWKVDLIDFVGNMNFTVEAAPSCKPKVMAYADWENGGWIVEFSPGSMTYRFDSLSEAIVFFKENAEKFRFWFAE